MVLLLQSTNNKYCYFSTIKYQFFNYAVIISFYSKLFVVKSVLIDNIIACLNVSVYTDNINKKVFNYIHYII